MSNFFAYATFAAQSDSPAATVLLIFSSADTCNKWWDIIQKTSWPKEIPFKKDNTKRSNPQWFSLPNAKGDAVNLLSAVDSNSAMKELKGEWTWQTVQDSTKPVIPQQDETGKVITDSESQKKIADLQAQLSAAKQASESKSNPSSQAIVRPSWETSLTKGENWKGGARFEGGPQHHAMVSEAFRMASELKDRGDDRSFTMIFSQLNMEQRRTVGIESKTSPEGGYNSSKLMSEVYAKAKELKDRGDDRNFSLIFSSLSMAYRRGAVQW